MGSLIKGIHTPTGCFIYEERLIWVCLAENRRGTGRAPQPTGKWGIGITSSVQQGEGSGAGGSWLSSQQSVFLFNTKTKQVVGLRPRCPCSTHWVPRVTLLWGVTPHSYLSCDSSSLSLRASLSLLKPMRGQSFQDACRDLSVYLGHVSQISSVGPKKKLLSSKALLWPPNTGRICTKLRFKHDKPCLIPESSGKCEPNSSLSWARQEIQPTNQGPLGVLNPEDG